LHKFRGYVLIEFSLETGAWDIARFGGFSIRDVGCHSYGLRGGVIGVEVQEAAFPFLVGIDLYGLKYRTWQTAVL
jgi:hypothetical protein